MPRVACAGPRTPTWRAQRRSPRNKTLGVGVRAARWALAIVTAVLAAGLVDVVLPASLENTAEARKREKRVKRTKPALRAKNVPLPTRAPTTPSAQTTQQATDAGPVQAGQEATSASDATHHTTAAVPLPPQPLATIEERAATVLEKHCARCHQAGALAGPVVSEGGIANILALGEIARNPTLVRPGEPDASPLYQQMIARQMPSDILRHGAAGTPPDAAEIRAVRAWIKGLPAPSANEACSTRTPATTENLVSDILRWLQAIGPERASDTRFVSLANLYNACASDAEMASYRQGVMRTLNSLTWSSQPVAIETIGESLVLLSVRLSDLGWTPEHWTQLTSGTHGLLANELPAAVREQTGTDIPIVNGDWLAFHAMQPQTYTRLLGLPPTLDDLARILSANLEDTRETRDVRRGIALESPVTGGPRVIERYATPRGPLWISHDYAAPEHTSILDFPLLPWASTVTDDPDRVPPRLIASRAIFTLPNGLPAFMLFNANGTARTDIVASHADAAGQAAQDRQSKANAPHDASTGKPPPPVRAPPPQAQPRITRLGLECAACHAGGPRRYTDSLADHLASDDYRGNLQARDLARAIAVSKPELEAFLTDDTFTVARAVGALGPNADASIDGHSPIAGLAARYERDLDLTAAAAELLMPVADLQRRLSRLSRSASPDATLALRLALARLSRAEFETLRVSLHRDDATPGALAALQPSLAGPTASDGKPQTASQPLPHRTLRLWPDRISYARNDRIILNVVSPRACHLTLVNVDHKGKATVLFPNEFTRDNLIEPGKITRLPPADALYFFRLQQPGTEKFIAICEEGQPVPAGMTPNLTHMNFTALGDWEEFLDTSVEAATRPRVPLDNGDDPDRRNRGRKSALPAPPERSPAQSRSAVTITIAP